MYHQIFFGLIILESLIVKGEWILSPVVRRIQVQQMLHMPKLLMMGTLSKLETNFMKFLVGHEILLFLPPKLLDLLLISKEMLTVQSILFARAPLFKRNMQCLTMSAVEEYRPVVMSFDKEDSLGYGRHSISFQNVCFNRLCFLTHDTSA